MKWLPLEQIQKTLNCMLVTNADWTEMSQTILKYLGGRKWTSPKCPITPFGPLKRRGDKKVFTMKTSSSRRPRPRGGPSASHTSPPPIFIYALNARVGQRGRNNISSHFPPTLTVHTSAKFCEKSPSRQTKLLPVEKRFVKVEAL